MGDPKEALPPLVSTDLIQALLTSKGLSKAVSVEPLKLTAQYHALYSVTIPQLADDKSEQKKHGEYILRISGSHLPAIKTRNEVAVMTWIRRNTSIPIPGLVAFDASDKNPIGHEYTLLERAPGIPLSDIYDKFTQAQHDHILDRLIDYLIELHSFPWNGIGGLRLERDDPEGNVILSRIVDEDFWQIQDIAKFWHTDDTVDTLNYHGPYETYLDLVSARIQKSAELIKRHDSLVFMHDILPRLDALLDVLRSRKAAGEDDSDRLNQVTVRLAHKDLHFANILVEPATADVTVILDWEFAGVVPFIEWNPRRPFLWNAKDGPESLEEKQRWMKRFEKRCRERDVGYILEDAEFSSPMQESVHKIHNYLRAIVEVSPRGQRQDLVHRWKNTVMENLALFRV